MKIHYDPHSFQSLRAQHKELTPDLKHRIETHWRHNLGSDAFETNTTAAAPKTYVLSMFPYPSGQLHMGHVRVYAISDAMARFYRMCGHRVLHPMGWDAFGLPAENAARQRGVAAADWTRANIAEMRTQLERLGCSFDWQREVCTSEPEYYRWTQWLFLRLHDEGMVYQAEALVNWDPVDETVLADEQVDAQGCSWRSGARVEKKLLRQWFVRTTRFAQRLLDGLNDEGLQDWRDIIKLQRHWIGECDGYRFEMPLEYDDTDGDATTTLRLRSVSLWTRRPEELRRASFVAVSPEHLLAKLDANAANDAVGEKGMVLRGVRVRNPFDDGQRSLPVVVVGRATGDEDATEARIVFDEGCDTYLGVVSSRRVDRLLASQLDIECGRDGDDITGSDADELCREAILREAQSRNIGGWPVSSKLKDWPISRQRAWGTPIPIVHCANCGAVPVPDAQLPVLLAEHANAPDNTATTTTTCPKCQAQDGRRESDTMDTFVDSSWYFLRYMDPHNREEPFSRAAADRTAPVDLYVGGKEHAVLHLYYARFMTQFLHSIGRVPVSEPFRRLLVQGMVMGRSYRVKGSGRYLRADEVCIVDAKKNLARTLAGDEAVVMQWEKMSKSKLNGADPTEAMDAHGTDSIRLIMLGDVAPTSHRNWSETSELCMLMLVYYAMVLIQFAFLAFPGILNWQKRLWLTLVEFNECRTAEATDAAEEERIVNSEAFREQESKLYDARNYFLKEATFNYKYSHQLSVAISKMQGLTNSIRVMKTTGEMLMRMTEINEYPIHCSACSQGRHQIRSPIRTCPRRRYSDARSDGTAFRIGTMVTICLSARTSACGRRFAGP